MTDKKICDLNVQGICYPFQVLHIKIVSRDSLRERYRQYPNFLSKVSLCYAPLLTKLFNS